MKPLLFLFFLFYTPILAQQVYQANEVDTKAEPSGGNVAWFQFINSNIRMPFKHMVAGVDGNVIIKGVVEPDGGMSDLQVVRGIDSLCNMEALRIVSMYKAWKPAMLGGKKVKQASVVVLKMKVPALTNYDQGLHAYVNYFDGNFQQTSDVRAIVYKSVVPVDSNGFVNADVIYSEKAGKKWRNIMTIPAKRKEIWYPITLEGMPKDSIKAISVSALDKYDANHAESVVFQKNGKMLNYALYDVGNNLVVEKKYDLNGMVRSLSVYSGDSSYTELGYYDNGQVRFAREVSIPRLVTKTSTSSLLGCWTQEGEQILKDGNGWWKIPGRTAEDEVVYEEGKVVNGIKDGKWIGKLADSTLNYQEIYAQGILEDGFAFYNGKKVTYTKAVVNPEFKTGINGFFKFLGSNMLFPLDASRGGILGKIVISFVVSEDGTLYDYKVEKGVGFGLEEEGVRLVKKSAGLWIPGSFRGKNVKVKYRLPINFMHE